MQNDPNTIRNKTQEQGFGLTETSPHKLSDALHDDILTVSDGAAHHTNNLSSQLNEDLSEKTSNQKNKNVTNYLGSRSKIDFK